MKKLFIVLWTVVAVLALPAREMVKNGDFQDGGRHWRVLRQSGLNSQNTPVSFAGNRYRSVLPQRFADNNGRLQLVQSMELDPSKEYLVRFTTQRQTRGSIFVSYRTSRNPRRNLGLTRTVELPPGEAEHSFVFSPGGLPKAGEGSEFCFQIGTASGETVIQDVSIQQFTTIPLRFGSRWNVYFKDPGTYRAMPVGEPDVSLTIPFDATPGRRHLIDFVRLGQRVGSEPAVVFSVIDAPEAGMMRAGFAADWFFEAYLNGEKVGSTMKKGNGSNAFSPGDNEVLLPVRKGRNLLAVKVRSGSGGWKLVWGTPEPPVRFVADENWKAIDAKKIQIEPGTALDLSAMIDAPAGKFGRAVVGRSGLLEFEKQPGKPVRLHGFTSFLPDDVWRTPGDREFRRTVTRFARAARRQGYNLFRMHGLDQWLMLDSQQDMKISPKFLDRWDYIISEFKKEGIYVQFVVFSFNLYSKGSGYQATFRRRNMHKMRLYMGGELEKERFRYGATTLLNHVNPYTKLAWKDDPAIVLVEYYNEQYLGMGRYAEAARQFPEDHKFVLSVWNRWLKNRYANVPRARWPEPLRKAGDGLVEIPDRKSPLINDYSIFCYERIKETNRWCESVIRAAGYKGLTTENCERQLNSAAAGWETLQVTDNHVYFCHPTNWFQVGSMVNQSSAIGQAAGYFRNLAGGRLAGRPQFVGEFNFCFWNPYQYEAGLVFNAYAAYQNFSSLAIHSHPVLNRGGDMQIQNFSSGSNPILRAAQFLSNMLFLRGDVTPSKKLVALTIPKEFLESDGNGMRAPSGEQTKLALMSGFSLAFPWAPTPKGISAGRTPDLAVLPAGAADVEIHGWFTNVSERTVGGKFSLDRTVKEMKMRGILPQNNISAPSKGIFQSDTGELTMRVREKLLKVVTPRTEAVAMAEGKAERLGAVSVLKNSTRGCVGVTSIDALPLPESRRMVIVYATEVVNSGMELGAGRARLVKPGSGPGLLRTGEFTLSIQNRNGGTWKLYALTLAGEREEELPVEYRNGALTLSVNTAKLKGANTPFFELVRVE